MADQTPMVLTSTDVTIYSVIRDIIGDYRADSFSQVILIPEPLASFGDENVSRAQISMGLFLVLYSELLERVPHALEYFNRKKDEQETIFLDHGAVRTVLTDTNGKLPPGQDALTRILVPLGYFHNNTYPLPKLKMTGRSYAHKDFPELLPQYFVSEFHPDQVEDDNFRKAVIKTVDESEDPLDQETLDNLEYISQNGFLPRQKVTGFLTKISKAFDRQHPIPYLSIYEDLRKHSNEMAWIATEGNAFNHATDRVNDVRLLSATEKQLGSPIKDEVEISESERILQTAYKADPILRSFKDNLGELIEKEVPGSFFEFIERIYDDEGNLDIGFDAQNATGIFKMTSSDEPIVNEFVDNEESATD